MFGCDCSCLHSLFYWTGVLSIASKVVPFLLKTLKGQKPIELEEKNWKRDVVYLYQLSGTPTASSTSPYCIKVEAFCRLYGLAFERRNTLSARGDNNLLPFIELNGERHSDSQIILRRLTHIFNLKSYPDDSSASIGHAIDRLLDNHTANLIMAAKLPHYGKVVEAMCEANGLPSLLLPIISRVGGFQLERKKRVKIETTLGKFSKSEYEELLRNDLLHLQIFLGGKEFLLGDRPTAVDCTAFGQFASNYYAVPSARFLLHDLLDSSEFTPLREYLERVKSSIFEDQFRDSK
ncbi:hypothetical protein PMAYCL1PPCAC_12032 [Pristionchus mayeri]|uniref:Glutathione S-transferase n=1 Tax=Pristionchus mayeri TaxID=1317129 RepID=A0AAN5CFH4_9BILA|nr:hypothetical protein PMAYCL1PPCAC_12032 [Pristionchus mayeri]